MFNFDVINELLEHLNGAKVFNTIDLKLATTKYGSRTRTYQRLALIFDVINSGALWSYKCFNDLNSWLTSFASILISLSLFSL